ncbi:MAG: RNA methyltransferase PUA domain-containing protein [Dongiaceae bacterium]
MTKRRAWDAHDPRLYVEQSLAAGVTIAADERAHHYLRNVMRRSAGDALALFNGRDGEFERRSLRSTSARRNRGHA